MFYFFFFFSFPLPIMYPIYSPYVHTNPPMRIFAWGYTYIRTRRCVYTCKAMPIYV